MRLSEAIRLGAMLKPQVFGALFVEVNYPAPGDVFGLRSFVGTCALGAASDAVGQNPQKQWLWVTNGLTKCPACQDYSINPHDTIAHLNDWHRWPREQIADWVATVEPHSNVSAIEPQPAVVSLESRP